jgi:hypothetical protein
MVVGKEWGRKRLGEIAAKAQNYVEEKGESEVKCFWSFGDGNCLLAFFECGVTIN